MLEKISCKNLREFGQKLGYPLNDDGICPTSIMLAFSMLADEEKSFFSRLKKIAKLYRKYGLKNIQQQISAVIKRDPKEKLNLIDIYAFFDGVELLILSLLKK